MAFEFPEACRIAAVDRYLPFECSEKLMKSWKELLPGVTERCRSCRHNRSTCEYFKLQRGGNTCLGRASHELTCSCSKRTIPPKLLRLDGWVLDEVTGSVATLRSSGIRAAFTCFPGRSQQKRCHGWWMQERVPPL